MALELAKAYVQIVPSMQGVQQEISRSLGAGGALDQSASAAGRRTGGLLSSGIAATMKSVAPYAAIALAGLGIAKLTGYVNESISAVANWQVLNAQSASAVKATGGAAGVTAGQVNALAQSLEGQTATQAESIQQGANLLLTFKNIRNEAGAGNDIFDQTTVALVDMARAMGTEPQAAAIQLGKALNDPIKGVSALTRVGVQFTDQQKTQIKALVESGDTMAAQKVILGELNSQFGGSGAAYAKTYTGAIYLMKDALGDIGETVSTGLLPAFTTIAESVTEFLSSANGPGLQEFSERLGVRLVDAAHTARDAVSDFINGATITPAKAATLSTPLEGFAKVGSIVRAAFDGAAPAVKTFGSYAEIMGPAVAKAIAEIAPALQKVLPKLAEATVKLLPSLVDLFIALAPVIPPVADIIKRLAPAVAKLADGLSWLITHAVVPLVEHQAGLFDFFQGLADGASTSKLMLDGLKGKFGPILQAAGEFGVTLGEALRPFISGIRDAVGAVIRLGVQIVTALTGLPGQMKSIGGNIVQGLIGGIQSAVGGVITAARNIASSAINAAKNALGIHSPSRAFAELGNFVGKGLSQGIDGSTSEVKATMHRLSAVLVEAFKAGDVAADVRSSVTSLVEKDNDRLVGLARRRDEVIETLAKAKERLKDALSTKRDYAANISGGILGLGNVTGAEGAVDEAGNAAAVTAADLIGTLKTAVTDTGTFTKTLAELQAMGLNDTTYKQLVDAFTSSGDTSFAQALLAGGQAAIGTVNSLQGTLAAQAKTLGATTSANLYQAGVDAAQGLVNGLKSKEDALSKQMEKLADSMVKRIKKKLGIKSPSRVMRDQVGVQIPLGMAAGIESKYDVVGDAMNNLVSIPRAASPAAMGAVQSGGGDGVTQNFYGQMGFTREQVADGIATKARRAIAGVNIPMVRVG